MKIHENLLKAARDVRKLLIRAHFNPVHYNATVHTKLLWTKMSCRQKQPNELPFMGTFFKQ